MAKKLWGGRFTKKTDKDFFDFQKSIEYDYKLAEYDILHSKIHVEVLSRMGILSKKEAKALTSALNSVAVNIKTKKINTASEDIHTEIQNQVQKIEKKLALKLHSLRSRNEQVVFDEKWYCLEKVQEIRKLLRQVQASLLFLAEKYKDEDRFPFIGYTHTQRAQAIPFKYYLLTYFYMLKRDYKRLEAFSEALFAYVGAGALAGSSLKRNVYDVVIKEILVEKPWKTKPVEHSLDNVSDRDFIIEFLAVLSIIQMHLSRLAEDFILYSTKEFNFISLPEEFCTGSSLMPHKKNPDFLELVRGYSGRLYGNLVSILTTMKGLPLTYNRDMQLDKEPLFSSVEVIQDELKIMARFIKAVTLNEKIVKQAVQDKTLYATELAEFLVQEYKVPFRQAHDIVGKLIILSEKKGGIDRIPEKELKKLCPALNKAVVAKIMSYKYAILSKKSISKKIPQVGE